MQELTVIEGLKIYGTKEEPLFLAKDIAELIGHSDVSMMLRSIDDDEKLIQTILVSGQNREVWMLKEHGLYEVLMMSRKPIAKKFKKKVKNHLTELRKHGVTATDNFIEKAISDPDFGIQMLTKLKEERQARLAAERKNKLFFDSKVTMTATEVVSILSVEHGIHFSSAQQFNKEMQRLKILKKVDGKWQPTTDKGTELKLIGYISYKAGFADNGHYLPHEVRYSPYFIEYLLTSEYRQLNFWKGE